MKTPRQRQITRTKNKTALRYYYPVQPILAISIVIAISITSLVWVRSVLAQNPPAATHSQQLSVVTQSPVVAAPSATNSTTSPTPPSSPRPVNLGDVMILDKLFNGNNNSIFNSQGLPSQNQSPQYSLGDLFALDKLFGGTGSLLSNNNSADSTLGNLMILGKLFSGTATGLSTASGQSSGTSLGNLFILNQLFAQTPAHASLNNDQNINGLGDLFMLKLFSGQ